MKKVKTLSISRQFLLWNFFIVIIFTLFSFFLLQLNNNAVENINDEHYEETVNQLVGEVASNYDALKKIIYYLSFQSNIQQYLKINNSVERLEYYDSSINTITTAMELNPNILNIIIEDVSGSRIMAQTSYHELPQISSDSADVSVSETKQSHDTQNYLLISTAIEDAYSDGISPQILGNIHLVVGAEAFIYSDSEIYDIENTQFYLSDKNKTPFWSNVPGELPTLDTLSGYSMTEIEEVGLHLYHNIAFYEPFEQLYYNFIVVIVVLAVMSVIIFLLFNVFMSNLVSPLYKLTNFISELQDGDLKTLNRSITLQGYTEVVTIATAFNRLLSYIQTLTEELNQATANLYKTKLLKSSAELHYLRAQINPHFLYNTLDSITGLSATEGSAQMVKVTKSLSAIFKYSVKGGDFATLKKEIEMAKNYIFIQEMRFAERFSVEYDLSPKSLSCIVPKMILQPVIENAFKHGIENTHSKTLLLIETGMIQENELYLRVTNGGAPVDSTELEKVNRQLLNDNFKDGQMESGIGLANVNSRIKLLYGEQFGVTISTEDCKTIVKIHMPSTKED